MRLRVRFLLLLLVYADLALSQKVRSVTSFEDVQAFIGYKQIYHFAEDSLQNIWIATDGGIFKFTGSEVSHYDLREKIPFRRAKHIRKIYVTRNNTVVIGSYEGFAVYSPQLDEFSPYELDTVHNSFDTHNLIFDITSDLNEVLYFATQKGIMSYNLTSLASEVLFDSVPVYQLEYLKGKLLFLSQGEKTNSMMTLSLEGKNLSLERRFEEDIINHIRINKSKNRIFYTGYKSFGDIYLDEEGLQITRFPLMDIDIYKGKISEKYWKRGTIWDVSNENNIGVRYLTSFNGKRYHVKEVNKGYSYVTEDLNDRAPRFFWSSDNTLWTSPYELGIKTLRFEDQLVTNLEVNVPNLRMNSYVISDNGTLYLLGEKAELIQLDLNSGESNSTPTYSRENNSGGFIDVVNTAFTSSSGVIATKQRDIFFFDRHGYQIQSKKYSENVLNFQSKIKSNISDVVVLGNGNILVSTISSITEFDSNFNILRSTSSLISKAPINLPEKGAIELFKLGPDKVLIKTLHQNSYVWDLTGNAISQVHDAGIVHNTKLIGDSLYVASSKGLAIFTSQGENYVRKRHLVDSRPIDGFDFDQNGNLWYLDITNIYGQTKSGKPIYTFFGIAKWLDGIPLNIFKIYNERLFISSQQKMVSINLSDYSYMSNLSKEINFSGVYGYSGAKRVPFILDEEPEVFLPFSQNILEIQFAPVDRNFLPSIRYEYRLVNLDSAWIKSPANNVRYSFLPYGDYIFEVRGRFPDESISTSKQLKFTIHPPFYGTLKFQLAMVLLLGSIVLVIWRQRENKKRALKDMQQKLAANIHDDLGTSLAKVSMYAELLSKRPEANYYEKLKGMLRDIKQTVSDSSWIIDSRESTLEDLIQRILLLHRESCLIVESECKQIIEIENGSKPLKAIDKENLYLLLKEYITNCLKYTQSIEMALEIIQKKNKLRVKLINDYSFIKQKREVVGGKGKSTIEMRINQLHGKVFELKNNSLDLEIRL